MDSAATEPPMLYRVKQLESAIRLHLDRITRPRGLTALQYTALTVLARRPGITAAEMARASFVSPQAAQGTAQSLEQKGLITRTPVDGRSNAWSLTPAGQTVVEQCAPGVARLDASMLDDLSPAERATLGSLLDRCVRAVRDH